ncbi:MAG: GDP-mannose 4,6-dehydratase [Acidocella sp.]|nr:GDP-mannose 4,6-dehydratase [Acidocella sp.]
MRRILITGAEGFVGQHLSHSLSMAGQEYIGTTLATLDITDAAAVDRLVSKLQPDACIHLAGVAAVDDAKQAPAHAWAVNLQGALNVGNAILAHAPECRMIFISSSECYGTSFKPGVMLDETALLAPLNLYAATKAAAEMALGALTSDGLRLLRLRPFNHFGPGQREAFVVPAFAGQIARIEAGLAPPEIAVGALDPSRDFLDVRDVCAAYVLALQKFDTLPNNSVFNISSGQAVQIGEVLNMLLEMTRFKISIVTDPARLRGVEIARAVGDAGLARRVLGWQPHYKLQDTLADVLAAARQAVQLAVQGASS